MSTALKLTVAEYDAMVAKGAFDEIMKKIELIYGEIQAMNPAGPVHDHIIEYLNHWSVQNTDFERVRVRIQSGLSLPERDSRPEPDVLWVRAGHPRDRHPGATDVLLAIEVADSSLRPDRVVKAKLYAEAGIAEYWIVDASRERLFVFRQPESGRYQAEVTIEVGDCATPLAEPRARLDLAKMFSDGR